MSALTESIFVALRFIDMALQSADAGSAPPDAPLSALGFARMQILAQRRHAKLCGHLAVNKQPALTEKRLSFERI